MGKFQGKANTIKAILFPSSSDLNPEIERLWAFATIENQIQEIQDFGENADLKQSIIDLGIEYGLVTDYTSMLVLRDEIFHERAIKRENKKRIEIESQARQIKSAQPVKYHRTDQKQPIFPQNRPNYGRGSIDGLNVLFLTLLFFWGGQAELKNQSLSLMNNFSTKYSLGFFPPTQTLIIIGFEYLIWLFLAKHLSY